jgi:magnesium-dependent phosphatase-1
MSKKPLLVFDCDYTLWPGDCDKNFLAPFNHFEGNTYDRYWRVCNPYADVREIFQVIANSGIQFAIASRNPSANCIQQYLNAIMIDTREGKKSIWKLLPENFFYAHSSGRYGKGKDLHFKEIAEVSKVPFTDMIFFDDFDENIVAARQQGTICVKIDKREGLTMDAFRSGMDAWNSKKNETPI